MKLMYVVCILVACLIVVGVGNKVFAATIEEEKEQVSQVLDTLHDAASKYEAERYFNLYAPDSVFLGTDATERWTLEEFKKWAVPYFESGKGWTYTKKARFVSVSADMNTAWFDESLMSEKYGECRGSGALIKVNGEWKIAQYNLTFPIPNAIAEKVTTMSKEEAAKK